MPVSLTATDSILERCENFGMRLPQTRRLLEGFGMNTSPEAVRFDDDTMWVSLSDGRTIAAPLIWFRRLPEATRPEAAPAR